MDLTALQNQLREFARERDWEQFHSPKNLAAALSVEASELLEIFQWMTEEESNSLDDKAAQSVADEICLLYTSPSPRDATLSRMPSSA